MPDDKTLNGIDTDKLNEVMEAIRNRMCLKR